MNAHRFLLLATALPALAAPPPEKDREAILAMAGTHRVHFRFEETAAVAPDYEREPEPYTAEATELVEVVEDTPERITLQHLLLIPGRGGDAEGEPRVIKHWAQVWTWQDTEILDYAGSEGVHEWKMRTLGEDEAEGTWSQLVTQVDDTPRYESHGSWTHRRGESSWESGLTRRPLPRREYTRRDDYDHLLVTNRHTLTRDGWLHFQDNRKVVDREDEPVRVLCHEIGLNRYVRDDRPEAEVARAWWDEHGAFWSDVRDFWIRSGENASETFAYTTFKGERGLSDLLDELQEDPPSAEAVAEALKPYAIIK